LYGRPIGVGDEMQEFYESWYALCPAPRRKHVLHEMVVVVFPAVVLPEENLVLVFGPRHISLTGLALYRSLNQADILRECNGHSMGIE
jgi:hypothetical protein